MDDKDWITVGWETLKNATEKQLEDVVRSNRTKGDSDDAQPTPPTAGQTPIDRLQRNTNRMEEYIEPDWEDLDHKANMIVARYAVVSGVWNILPPPLDIMGVTAIFAKMTSDLSGVYQVMVSAKRAREMGWAIATTTASVLGVAYAGSRLMQFIPGAGWIASLLVKAPLVAAVSWAAGDTLKWYFKQTRRGVEPGLKSLQEAFAHTLRLKLKTVKKEVVVPEATVAAAPAPVAAKSSVTEALEQIASLHELMRSGAITQEEFDLKKKELLAKI